MNQLMTLSQYTANHTVTSSGVSTVDMYWSFVQYKLYNIIYCNDRKYGVVEDTISDANFGIYHIDLEFKYGDGTPMLQAYKDQFQYIIKQLQAL